MTRPNSDREWMVWGDGLPKVRHTSHGKALAEAHRLAKKHPGQEFVLLEVKKVIVYQTEPETPTIVAPKTTGPLGSFRKQQRGA